MRLSHQATEKQRGYVELLAVLGVDPVSPSPCASQEGGGESAAANTHSRFNIAAGVMTAHIALSSKGSVEVLKSVQALGSACEDFVTSPALLECLKLLASELAQAQLQKGANRDTKESEAALTHAFHIILSVEKAAAAASATATASPSAATAATAAAARASHDRKCVVVSSQDIPAVVALAAAHVAAASLSLSEECCRLLEALIVRTAGPVPPRLDSSSSNSSGSDSNSNSCALLEATLSAMNATTADNAELRLRFAAVYSRLM